MTWIAFPAGTCASIGIEEADELLMAVALHAAADDLAFEDVEGGEQRGGAVALVVVGHRPAAARLHRQPRLGAVERLDLALLVDARDHGMGGRIDVEADDVLELLGELGVVRQLERAHPVRRKLVGLQIRCTERRLIPTAFAIAAAVQWVASLRRRPGWPAPPPDRRSPAAAAGCARAASCRAVSPSTPSA